MSGTVPKLAIDDFMANLARRSPNQPEFHQAVSEVLLSVLPLVQQDPALLEARILERLVEPDRVISFRVTWEDDAGRIQVNRGYRVQFSNALGAYKGGLRFHPSVNEGVLKFLAFEQIFKNSLTGLPMGGGKGGSDFDPKGKSDREVMRFCQSFMQELYRYVGDDVDVPAGDIGVSHREIGFLVGTYRRITRGVNGFITGKPIALGGSATRTEATGYGVVYFCEQMLRASGSSVIGKKFVVSGSGNVATYAIEKIMDLGGQVIALSDSEGFIHDPAGINTEKLAFVKELKEVKRGRISEYAKAFKSSTFHRSESIWSVPCDVALPCATQNELTDIDAKMLIKNGVRAVVEGANMPCTLDAVNHLHNAGVLVGPAKAANAGGVAVSGLEQSQNAQRLVWTASEVDEKLKGIMASIHAKCLDHGGVVENTRGAPVPNYVAGANIAGFRKVADAMLRLGIV